MAALENYFTKASEDLGKLIPEPGRTKRTRETKGNEQGDEAHLKNQAEGINEEQKTERKGREETEWNQRGESLKLSIVETQRPEEASDRD